MTFFKPYSLGFLSFIKNDKSSKGDPVPNEKPDWKI
jgi:hypothetical protein